MSAVFFAMTNLYNNAHCRKTVGYCTFSQVRARYLIALIFQYLSNAAHADATNTHEVDMTNPTHFRHLINQRWIVCINHWRPPDSNSRLSPLHLGGPACVLPPPSSLPEHDP